MLLIIGVVKQKRGSKGSKIRGKWREMEVGKKDMEVGKKDEEGFGFGRQGGMRVRGE